MAEDSDEDFEAVGRAWRAFDHEFVLRRFADGDAAPAFLLGHRPPPSFVLLDPNPNGTGGHETPTIIKRDEKLCIIPVIVLTTSTDPKDIEFCCSQQRGGLPRQAGEF